MRGSTTAPGKWGAYPPTSFGRQPFGQPYSACHIRAYLDAVPDEVKPSVLRELANILGPGRACGIPLPREGATNTKDVFNGTEFAREPDMGKYLNDLGWAVTDFAIDLVADSKSASDIPAKLNDRIAEELGLPAEDTIYHKLRALNSENKQDGTHWLDDNVHNAWVEKWYRENAWDFDADERHEVNNPYLNADEMLALGIVNANDIDRERDTILRSLVKEANGRVVYATSVADNIGHGLRNIGLSDDCAAELDVVLGAQQRLILDEMLHPHWRAESTLNEALRGCIARNDSRGRAACELAVRQLATELGDSSDVHALLSGSP